MVDAVSAGKDIYCEKPMSHSLADGHRDGRRRRRRADGSCRSDRSAELRPSVRRRGSSSRKACSASFKLVEGSLGRNDPTGAWVYPPPPDLSPSTSGLGHLAGRCPEARVGPEGLRAVAVLEGVRHGRRRRPMVHLISGMLFTWGINEAPTRVVAMGGIRRFNDGRNMPDVHTSLFDYREVPVHIRLNLGPETPEVLRFLGSKGILELAETSLAFSSQAGVDTGPSYYASSFPEPLRDEYFKKWHTEHDPKPGEEPLHDALSYQGTGRRHPAASLEVLSGREDAAAGGPGRRLRPPRGGRLPHGERIVTFRKTGDVRCGDRHDQELTRRDHLDHPSTTASAGAHGFDGRWLRRRRGGRQVPPILNAHRLSPGADIWNARLPPARMATYFSPATS